MVNTRPQRGEMTAWACAIAACAKIVVATIPRVQPGIFHKNEKRYRKAWPIKPPISVEVPMSRKNSRMSCANRLENPVRPRRSQIYRQTKEINTEVAAITGSVKRTPPSQMSGCNCVKFCCSIGAKVRCVRDYKANRFLDAQNSIFKTKNLTFAAYDEPNT